MISPRCAGAGTVLRNRECRGCCHFAVYPPAQRRRGLVVWQAVFIAQAASRGDDEQQCHWHDTRYEWQGAGATDDRGIEELADENASTDVCASVVSSTLPLVWLKSHV